MSPGRARLTVALATVGLLLSGCAQAYPGSAQRTGGFDPNVVQPALLDVGNYPTKPRDALGTVDDTNLGAQLEARRVAENTVQPFQVDPTLTSPGMPWVIKDEDSLAGQLGNDDIAAAAEGHKFVSGFDIGASDGSYQTAQKSLHNAVAIFATPDDAAAAAPGIIAAAKPTAGPGNGTGARGAITIPHYPDTRAWLDQERRTGGDGNADRAPWQVVQAFTVHGRYLLVQTAKAATAEAAAELVATTLDQQGPLIDAFVPTPYDQLAAMPMDPSGLWARMLVDTTKKLAMMGVYGPHGGLAFYEPPADFQRAFTESGVDLVAYGMAFVERAKDPAAAKTLADFIVADYQKNGHEGISGIPWLPEARCQQKPKAYSSSTRLSCVATADRYVITVDGLDDQETNTKQIVAAQYLMLTAM